MKRRLGAKGGGVDRNDVECKGWPFSEEPRKRGK